MPLIAQDYSCPTEIFETAIKVNDDIKLRMIENVVDLCESSINGKTIAVYA